MFSFWFKTTICKLLPINQNLHFNFWIQQYNSKIQETIFLLWLKVSKSRKQIMVSSVLPKNERWDNFHYIKSSQCSFFGRIEDTIICFWHFLTFRRLHFMLGNCMTMRMLSKYILHSLAFTVFQDDDPKTSL